jgi:hypothetical protein
MADCKIETLNTDIATDMQILEAKIYFPTERGISILRREVAYSVLSLIGLEIAPS